MNKKLLLLGLIMSMMCMFLVSCDVPHHYYHAGERPPIPTPNPDKPIPPPKPRISKPPEIVGPCGAIELASWKDLTDPSLPRDAIIKSKRNRPAKFTTCGDMTEQANREIKLEVRQNGRVLGTFYRSKNSRHSISLSCNSDVQLTAISTGYDICGLTMTSVGAQLSGGEKDGSSTFFNRQNYKGEIRSNRDKLCRVELRETLYEPLVVIDNLESNRIEISTCESRGVEMYLFIRYKE